MNRQSVSRREFLRLAGLAGAGLGLSAGLGGLVAGCGDEAEPTITTQSPTTTVPTPTTAGTTSSTAASITTVSTAAEMGRELKIGVVSPQTGGLAVFGRADKWSAGLTNKALAEGLVAGDGKKHPVKIVFRDTQSDASRAAAVAGDMITADKVDILVAAGSPDTVNPAADQAETLETPFLSCFNIWPAFIFGRGGSLEQPFKWTFGQLLGLEQVCACMVDVFDRVTTNKKVAFLAMNNADGMAWLDEKSGAPPFLEAAGYSIVAPGLYTPGSDDFTAQITEFKKEGCEVLTGASTSPDFTNFWRQSLQQGFKPPIASQALALGFAQAAEAIGPSVCGLIAPDGSWHCTFPFRDSITGMTCQELADDYEATTGSEWNGAIGGHAKISWAVDVLSRTKNPDDKESILEAINTTKMETILGPIDMTAPIDQNPMDPAGRRPHANVVKPVMTALQWVKGQKWPYEQVVIANKLAPQVPTVPLQPIEY